MNRADKSPALGNRVILMLEDDEDRVQRFTAAMRSINPSLQLVFWRDANLMNSQVADYLDRACLISLDHDLEPETADSPDPGDGLVVVKGLVAHPQPCPVVIHSSNRTRSDWMAGEFELAGWTYRTVAPIGERWIEEYWRPVVRAILKRRSEGRMRSIG